MAAGAAAWAGQGDAAVVRIAVLTQLVDRPPALSNLEPPPHDSGLLGGRMAIAENNTTGRFMRQRFEVRETVVPADGDAVAAFKALAGDGKLAFVALGPANRVAVIDGGTLEVRKYLPVGQRVWQLAFSPDESKLFTTNGVSNDVSVIDVKRLKVVKSITVGRFPWGIVVK